jgi:hypothetical protein
MKLTKTGYRITKNGNVIKSVERGSIISDSNRGSMFKENGVYYFLNRKQGGRYIYLP